MRKLFKSKKTILSLIAGSSLVISTSFIGILTITNSYNNNFSHYVFDGKTFNTKEELNEYIDNNINYTSKETAQDFYLYDSKPYAVDSLYDITKDLEKKYSIKEYKTYKNINSNIIDTSNQLSDNVITNENEKLIEIYKGSDNRTYTSKNEAIDTFQDIKKQYMINNLNGQENIEFSNQNDAIAYYESVIRKQIESGEQTDKYNISGLDMTKEQVLQWIGQTSDTRYEHNGFYWSPSDIPNISNLNLTNLDKEKIQPFKPIKNAYWLNFDSNGLSGTFSGPQYIESNLSTSQFMTQLYTGWNRVETKGMNALLAPLMGISSFIKASANLTERKVNHEWDLEDLFVTNVKQNVKTLNELFKNIYKFDMFDSESFKYKLIKNNLSSVHELPVFEKNLVFFKNLYLFIITRNNNDLEQEVLDLINFLKQTLRELIESTTTIVDNEFLDSLFIEETLETTRKENILNFSDIIDLFLNPSKFQYTSPSKLVGMDGLLMALNDVGDIIFGDFDKINELKKNISKTSEEIKKLSLDNALYQFEKTKFSSAKEKKQYQDELIKKYDLAKVDSKTGEVKFKKNDNKPISPMKGFDKALAGFNVAKAVWDIGNIVSFLSYRTYENDLGNGQVLKYQVIGFKIPLLGIEIDNDDFKKNINQVPLIQTDSAFMPEPDKTTNPNEDGYYIVYGSLFTGIAKAEEYLKNYIVSNPLRFSDTNMLYINVMSQQEEFEVKIDNSSDNENEMEYQFITQFEEFKLKIFDKYFASKSVKQYSDGFGNFFQNKADALNSMSQNITNKKFLTKYKITNSGMNYYYDTLNQAWEQQKKFLENKIESKTILNSDLIKTTYYNELEEYNGINYSIFKVYFKGKNRYFATYNDALYYIFNNSDIKRKTDTSVYYEISFRGMLFTSEAVFYQWVSKNTKEVKG
ncbi:hypothetical protein [Spiroplasma endosymbiont of Cantharis rufa]|uniref:hypothetical protein n=1 Tax=Spiroplasma endosymbiont of Cantharis rufa TaxID=3066279 RepID=UPI0030CEE882